MSSIVSGRAEACAGRPWPADRVEHWPTERLIPYANNPRLIAERDPLPRVGRVGLGVRIRLPPAVSLQTLGPSAQRHVRPASDPAACSARGAIFSDQRSWLDSAPSTAKAKRSRSATEAGPNSIE
jgi:hypothetical protein